MDTSTSNITLKLIQKPNMIPTQICVPVDCSRINRSIYYPPVLQIYRVSTQLTSDDCKNSTNSYNFFQITLVRASLSCRLMDPIFVVIASLQPEKWVCKIFHFMPWWFSLLFFIHSHTKNTCAQCQRALLPTFLAMIGTIVIISLLCSTRLKIFGSNMIPVVCSCKS